MARLIVNWKIEIDGVETKLKLVKKHGEGFFYTDGKTTYNFRHSLESKENKFTHNKMQFCKILNPKKNESNCN